MEKLWKTKQTCNCPNINKWLGPTALASLRQICLLSVLRIHYPSYIKWSCCGLIPSRLGSAPPTDVRGANVVVGEVQFVEKVLWTQKKNKTLNKCCKKHANSVVSGSLTGLASRLIYMTSSVGSRSIHATQHDRWIDTRSMHAVGFLISTSFLTTQITQVQWLFWAGPGFRLLFFSAFYRPVYTYFSTDLLPIFISYNFVFFLSLLLYTNYLKKSLRVCGSQAKVFGLIWLFLFFVFFSYCCWGFLFLFVGLRRCPNSQL